MRQDQAAAWTKDGAVIVYERNGGGSCIEAYYNVKGAIQGFGPFFNGMPIGPSQAIPVSYLYRSGGIASTCTRARDCT